jgi:hypothetical protein
MATHDDQPTPRGDESFGDNPAGSPSGDQSMGDAPREPRPVPSAPPGSTPTAPTPTPPAAPSSGGNRTSLLIGGGIAILVVLAAIIGFAMK